MAGSLASSLEFRLLAATVACVPAPSERGTPNQRGIVCVTLSLALGNYLMFDHTMRCRAGEKNYGDYSDVQ
jgi:hypothetical protein